jgi:hypothetical protein
MMKKQIIFASEKVMIESLVESKKTKYFYIRDDKEPRRVLTIGYMHFEDKGVIVYSCTLNKVVPKSTYTIDPRLRKVMGKREFQALVKTFRKRFGGDAFSRKVARAIMDSRIGPHFFMYDGSKKILLAIVNDILAQQWDSDLKDLSLRTICFQVRDRFANAEQK